MGTAPQRERTADFFSFVLAVSGVTLDTIEKLEEKDFDLIRAVTAQSCPLMEQSILADLVGVGTVVGVEQSSGMPDAHNHTLRVVMSDVLKGAVPTDTVLIRQKRRVSPQSPDTKPEEGETFLFLASNGLYRYDLHRNTDPSVRPPEAEMRRRYSIYRRYRIFATGACSHYCTGAESPGPHPESVRGQAAPTPPLPRAFVHLPCDQRQLSLHR
jgi:hypothetical protein